MPATRFRIVRFLLFIAALSLLVAACGSGGGADRTAATTTSSATATSTAPASGARVTEPAQKVQSIPVALTATIMHVGAKTGGGIPIPQNALCTKSIPATCHVTITCPVAVVAGVANSDADVAICAWLAESPESIFEPGATDQVCTQQYGGPETATITGTRDGQPIDASYARTNGCEISRFDAVAPIWTGEVPVATDGAPQSIDGVGSEGAAPDPTR